MQGLSQAKRKCIWIISNDRVSQFCFIFGLGGIASFGVLFVLPYLYNDIGTNAVLTTRMIGCFMAFQMFINWLCVKYVDTSYNPVRDGTRPESIEMGQNVSRISIADEKNTNIAGKDRNGDYASLNKRNVGSLMDVASETRKSVDEPSKRTTYPYFSWTPCLRCNRPRPPRCHHCPQCNVCILKRDHHCFFAGTCIGYRNLRHFSVFLFWATVATLFSTVHAVPYYYYHVMESTSFFDLLFPVAVIRAVIGYICWKFAFFIVLVWILVIYLFWATSFFHTVVNLINLGKTTFEVDNNMELTDRRSLAGKLGSVYGHYWLLNFVIPLHFFFEPIDDPLNWPHVKA